MAEKIRVTRLKNLKNGRCTAFHLGRSGRAALDRNVVVEVERIKTQIERHQRILLFRGGGGRGWSSRGLLRFGRLGILQRGVHMRRGKTFPRDGRKRKKGRKGKTRETNATLLGALISCENGEKEERRLQMTDAKSKTGAGKA